jgi:hypothetical protein
MAGSSLSRAAPIAAFVAITRPGAGWTGTRRRSRRAAAQRRTAARGFLARNAAPLAADERERIADETLAILDDPRFAALFAAGSRAEAPIVGRITNGRFHEKTAGTSWLEAVRAILRRKLPLDLYVTWHPGRVERVLELGVRHIMVWYRIGEEHQRYDLRRSRKELLDQAAAQIGAAPDPHRG